MERHNTGHLSEAFSNAITNSRDSRIQDLNEKDLDVTGIIRETEHLASAILDGAYDVVSDGSATKARSMLRCLFSSSPPAEDPLEEHVLRAIDEKIGEMIVQMQASGENRFWKLVLMGENALITHDVSRYLKRVSLCYLIGLDEQSVILCRTVLEAAFGEAISDRVCDEASETVNHNAKRASFPYTLEDRIRAARASGVIEEVIARQARSVKLIANRLIHPNHGEPYRLSENTLDRVLLQTINVVKALSGN